eukprot:1017501-Prorocentrum_minimum.AAC.2
MVSDISANGGLVRNDFTGTLVCLKGAEGFVGVERRGNFWVLSSAKGPQVNGRGLSCTPSLQCISKHR